MASAQPAVPPDGGGGSEVLDALAEAVLHRLDHVLGERVESLTAHAATPTEPRWLRVSDVARRVGASERTVYRALRSGALAGERLGAHWRIRPESVDAWLATYPPPRPSPGGLGSVPASPPQARSAPAPRTFMTRARRLQKPPPGRATTSRRAMAPGKGK